MTRRGDEDGDDAEEDEQEGEQDPAMDQDQLAPHIKAEPGDKEYPRKGKVKASPNELPILGEDDLRKFRKEELLADVAHLQGWPLRYLGDLGFSCALYYRPNR